MSAQHTPGPWKVIPCDGGFRTFDTGDYTVVSENMIVPALVWGGAGSREGEANARLIAAAPDMLEALQWLMKQTWKSTDKDNMEFQCNTSCYVRDALLAAIAKATGGEHG